MNRIQNEVEHGKYLANNPEVYWGWAGEVGRTRLKRRAKMLSEGLSGKVLEVGCGSGLFTTELIKSQFHLTSIDISPDLLDLARQAVSEQKNVAFRLEDVHATSFPDESFDAVIGSSVLHHLDLEVALKEILRILKPGGTIRFTEPNYLNPQVAIQKSHPAIRKMFHESPDETAFIKWNLRKELISKGFSDIFIENFDFLHPKTPKTLLTRMIKGTLFLEKVPILKEISGSLFITARK
jgi:ubiquinone/menaquinone biosynthesis C-methylase UbiE